MLRAASFPIFMWREYESAGIPSTIFRSKVLPIPCPRWLLATPRVMMYTRSGEELQTELVCFFLPSSTSRNAVTAPTSTSTLSLVVCARTVSYTHLRAHETPEHLVCRLLLEKKKKKN
eukprot:TRINITY_DN28111_c0_g1_i4.p1 TRINITY_DN28111_c0_g1~~TRINITY_DN28111_c0_g1_i4.p1  ORF type:complete len:118 (-),score=34.99 TRINITY_DN28111_c0_g1_i4:63-416(-)